MPRASKHSTVCKLCGTSDIVGFGRTEQLVRDQRMPGKRVGIYVATTRSHCRSCKKTFFGHHRFWKPEKRKVYRVAGKPFIRYTFRK